MNSVPEAPEGTLRVDADAGREMGMGVGQGVVRPTGQEGVCVLARAAYQTPSVIPPDVVVVVGETTDLGLEQYGRSH